MFVMLQRGTSPWIKRCSALPPGKTRRLQQMSAKILSAFVTAVLLGTTALASAQGRPDWNDPYLRGLTPDYAVQQNPYVGPAWDGMAPYGNMQGYPPQYYNYGYGPDRGPQER